MMKLCSTRPSSNSPSDSYSSSDWVWAPCTFPDISERIQPKQHQLARAIVGVSFLCFCLTLFFCIVERASAFTQAPSEITEDTVWTKEESPYVISSALIIPSGLTLTIDPGVIIKFADVGGIYVYGNLIAGAMAGEPVVFTSIKDDVGGDTNRDGVTTIPAAGDWNHPITFYRYSQGTFLDAVIRYGGLHDCNTGNECRDIPMIQNDGVFLYFAFSILRDSAFAAISQRESFLNVSSSLFLNNFYGIQIAGTDGYSGGKTIVRNSSFVNTSISISNQTENITDARFNWWGDERGPKDGTDETRDYESGLTSGPIAIVPLIIEDPHSGLQGFSEPIATTTPICVSDCFSNVLFLPGLEASRLYDAEPVAGVGNELRLWEPSQIGGSFISKLFLDDTGKSIRDDIYTRDVIDEALIPLAGPNIYKSFLKMLQDMKDAGTMNDWQAVPYDWRLSVDDILESGTKNGDVISYLQATSTPYIIQELKRLAATSKTGKVTIVAHSNGGLLAKALMMRLASEGHDTLVDKIIFVAVPQIGIPQAAGALLHGFDQSIGFGIIMPASKAMELGKNMPGAYGLLPSAAYIATVPEPIIDFKDSQGVSATDFASFIKEKKNSYLVDQAADLHSKIDAWQPPENISIIEIAGWGLDTVQGIEYNDHGYKPVITENGDGTVVLPSALYMSASTTTTLKKYWVDLEKYDSFDDKVAHGHIVNRKHADILEIDDVLALIKSDLQNGTVISSPYISEIAPESHDQSERMRFYLHSPGYALDLFDEEGRHTGFSTTTNLIEEQIPDTFYGEFGDVRYASFKSSRKITAVITPITDERLDDGLPSASPVVLDIEQIVGDEIASTTSMTDLPLSTTTPLMIDISSFDSLSVIKKKVEEADNSTPIPLEENNTGETEVVSELNSEPERRATVHSSLRRLLPVATARAAEQPRTVIRYTEPTVQGPIHEYLAETVVSSTTDIDSVISQKPLSSQMAAVFGGASPSLFLEKLWSLCRLVVQKIGALYVKINE